MKVCRQVLASLVGVLATLGCDQPDATIELHSAEGVWSVEHHGLWAGQVYECQDHLWMRGRDSLCRLNSNAGCDLQLQASAVAPSVLKSASDDACIHFAISRNRVSRVDLRAESPAFEELSLGTEVGQECRVSLESASTESAWIAIACDLDDTTVVAVGADGAVAQYSLGLCGLRELVSQDGTTAWVICSMAGDLTASIEDADIDALYFLNESNPTALGELRYVPRTLTLGPTGAIWFLAETDDGALELRRVARSESQLVAPLADRLVRSTRRPSFQDPLDAFGPGGSSRRSFRLATTRSGIRIREVLGPLDANVTLTDDRRLQVVHYDHADSFSFSESLHGPVCRIDRAAHILEARSADTGQSYHVELTECADDNPLSCRLFTTTPNRCWVQNGTSLSSYRLEGTALRADGTVSMDTVAFSPLKAHGSAPDEVYFAAGRTIFRAHVGDGTELVERVTTLPAGASDPDSFGAALYPAYHVARTRMRESGSTVLVSYAPSIDGISIGPETAAGAQRIDLCLNGLALPTEASVPVRMRLRADEALAAHGTGTLRLANSGGLCGTLEVSWRDAARGATDFGGSILIDEELHELSADFSARLQPVGLLGTGSRRGLALGAVFALLALFLVFAPRSAPALRSLGPASLSGLAMAVFGIQLEVGASWFDPAGFWLSVALGLAATMVLAWTLPHGIWALAHVKPLDRVFILLVRFRAVRRRLLAPAVHGLRQTLASEADPPVIATDRYDPARSEASNLLVVANPGVGKTHLLRTLFREEVNNFDGDTFPVWCEHDNVDLHAQAASTYGTRIPTAALFTEALYHLRVVLFIDDIDGHEGLGGSAIRPLFSDINSFRVVASARTDITCFPSSANHADSVAHDLRFNKFLLRPMTLPEASELARSYDSKFEEWPLPLQQACMIDGGYVPFFVAEVANVDSSKIDSSDTSGLIASLIRGRLSRYEKDEAAIDETEEALANIAFGTKSNATIPFRSAAPPRRGALRAGHRAGILVSTRPGPRDEGDLRFAHDWFRAAFAARVARRHYDVVTEVAKRLEPAPLTLSAPWDHPLAWLTASELGGSCAEVATLWFSRRSVTIALHCSLAELLDVFDGTQQLVGQPAETITFLDECWSRLPSASAQVLAAIALEHRLLLRQG